MDHCGGKDKSPTPVYANVFDQRLCNETQNNSECEPEQTETENLFSSQGDFRDKTTDRVLKSSKI